MNYLAIVWDPSIGLDLGFITLRYYSLMFVLAFLLGIRLMKKMFKNDGLQEELVDSLFVYTVIATVLGARLGHVFFYDWAYYQNHLEEILLPFRFKPHFEITGFSGLASHGAAISIVAVVIYFSLKILKQPILFLLDRMGIVVALAGVFIRLGNLINSEIVGKPTHSNYGVVFKKLGEDFPRHPTQIYESIAYLAIFILLWNLYWKTDKKKQKGFLFGLFFALLWSARFCIEFLKEAQVDGRDAWTLNTGQYLSIPLISIGLIFIFLSKKKQIQ